MTKTDTVKRYISLGMYKEALRIVKGFRIGVTAEDRNIFSMAYECILYPDFYRSLGINPQLKTEEGITLLKKIFNAA